MDRLVSHVTARPYTLRTIKLNIQLPCSETAFLFEESSSGSTSTLETGPRLDCTEVLPFFIKTVALWGTMTDIFANGVRGSTSNSPTDPNGAFYQAEQEIKIWKDTLPSRMQWSMKNYRTHRVLGQGSLFVSMHFVLNHALCVAHQEYLPQLDNDSIFPLTADADRPASCNVVNTCIHHADEITRIASSLYGGDAIDKEMLCAPFVGVALECAACCHLWSIYLHEQVPDPDTLLSQPRATPRQKLRLLGDILKSWSEAWPIAAAWYETIELLTRLYDAARPGGSPILQVEDVGDENPPAVCGDVSLGSGLPDPRTSTITNRLIDKIRLIIMTVSENSGLRNRQTRLWIENLCSHTWQQAQAAATTTNTAEFGDDTFDPLASFSNFSNFEDVLEFMGGYEDFQAFDPFINANSGQVDQQLLLPFP
ncbi:fungal specific transcription factor [Phlyctema vagabunda]|uniref:Fungal specific transcription factor n=1 Tax=Phlyctema vagabunda TaxID=108571 RepID=A0ABR4P1M0_9HELO